MDFPQHTGGTIGIEGLGRISRFEAHVDVHFTSDTLQQPVHLSSFLPDGYQIGFNPMSWRKRVTLDREEKIIHLPSRPKNLQSIVFPFIFACAQARFPDLLSRNPRNKKHMEIFYSVYKQHRSVSIFEEPFIPSRKANTRWEKIVFFDQQAMLWTLSAVAFLRAHDINLLPNIRTTEDIFDAVRDPKIEHMNNGSIVGVNLNLLQKSLHHPITIGIPDIMRAIRGEYLDDYEGELYPILSKFL